MNVFTNTLRRTAFLSIGSLPPITRKPEGNFILEKKDQSIALI